MKLTFFWNLIASLLMAHSIHPQASDPSPCALVEPSSVTAVRGALELGKNGLFVGNYEKILPLLGDTASVAIIKLVDQNDLLKPEILRAALYVLKSAFSAPNLISRDIDKEPKVALFLLAYLHENEANQELKKLIEETEKFVKASTEHPRH